MSESSSQRRRDASGKSAAPELFQDRERFATINTFLDVWAPDLDTSAERLGVMYWRHDTPLDEFPSTALLTKKLTMLGTHVCRARRQLLDFGLLIEIEPPSKKSAGKYRIARASEMPCKLPPMTTDVIGKGVTTDVIRPQMPQGYGNGGHRPMTTDVNPSIDKRDESIKSKKARFDAAAVSLPSALDTPEFRSVWQDWCRHRSEIRKPLKQTTVTLQLQELASWGHDTAIRQIREAITRGWQGYFPPKDKSNAKRATRSEREYADQDPAAMLANISSE
jgi:hypothetical protein